MSKVKFNYKKYTVQFFRTLSEQCGNNKSLMAKELGINRTKLYRWMENADKYAKEQERKNRPSIPRKQKHARAKVPTINQLFEFMKGQPDHVHYSWFMRHMNQPRKHYHAAIQKTLDVVNEYQEK